MCACVPRLESAAFAWTGAFKVWLWGELGWDVMCVADRETGGGGRLVRIVAVDETVIKGYSVVPCPSHVMLVSG
jgi:hypothetical protein